MTPDVNFNGLDSMTIKINDTGKDYLETIEFNVNPDNDSITITNPVDLTLLEDGTWEGIVTIDNIDNDVLTYNINTNFTPSNGTASISKIDDYSAKLTYTPNPNHNGTDTFEYIVNDGEENVKSITLNITKVVDYVTFNTPNIIFTEDTDINQQLSFYNPDGYTITTSVSSDISRGTVTITTQDDSSPTYHFTSLLNINTTKDLMEFQIDYIIPGINGNPSENVMLTQEYPITITAVNDIPTIIGDSITSTAIVSSHTLPTGFDPDVNDVENPDSLTYEFSQSDISELELNTDIRIQMTDSDNGIYDVSGTDTNATVEFRVIDKSNIPSHWQILQIN